MQFVRLKTLYTGFIEGENYIDGVICVRAKTPSMLLVYLETATSGEMNIG